MRSHSLPCAQDHAAQPPQKAAQHWAGPLPEVVAALPRKAGGGHAGGSPPQTGTPIGRKAKGELVGEGAAGMGDDKTEVEKKLKASKKESG